MSVVLSKKEIVELAFEIIIKAVVLGVILYYALAVMKPFLIPVLWGIIIAVTLAPLIDKLEKRFQGKRTMIITIFTISTIGLLLLPTYILSDSVISSSKELAHDLKAGTLTIPPPSESVKAWPLVGDKIYNLWDGAASNLTETLLEFKPQLKEYGGKIASAIGGALGAVLMFVISLVIAAIFLSNSEGSVKVYQAISRRLVGEKGVEWANLSALTIRSVVQGVIGIAIIQSTLALIGLLLIGMPFAWLWAFIVLFLAIIQLPPLLILGPIIAYVFSYAEATPATIFAVYAALVSASDGFLKPLLLGRGVDIPMLVILLGAIGGMILSGILGLFLGAVGLALAYKLFMVWLDHTELEEELDAPEKAS